ncbi:MAG: hypothetical protein ACFFA4_17005 [Promethearchaeota archaeon]
MDRGCGNTAKQISEAPDGAIFVWVNSNIDYPKSLAIFLCREDLEIVSPDWLTSHRYMGRRLSGIVIDHSARLTVRQYEGLESARTRVVNDNRQD